MMNAILIGDVGATGSDWILATESGKKKFTLGGYNPVSQEISRLDNLLEAVRKEVESVPVEVYYYGAGVGIASQMEEMTEGFRRVLNISHLELASDLLGAAKALCADQPGVVCILGTGSNACMYDGSELKSGHSLGYPLGDEGSGMDIGRKMVKAFYYGLLPADLQDHFGHILPTHRLDFLKEFRSKEAPNQYLASFVEYALEFDNQLYIRETALEAFTDFINFHLHSVERNSKINAVGSIAFYFCGEFEKCLQRHLLQLGNILQKPIDALATFHLSQKNKL